MEPSSSGLGARWRLKHLPRFNLCTVLSVGPSISQLFRLSRDLYRISMLVAERKMAFNFARTCMLSAACGGALRAACRLGRLRALALGALRAPVLGGASSTEKLPHFRRFCPTYSHNSPAVCVQTQSEGREC